MKSKHFSILFFFIRFTIYIFVMVALNMIFMYDASHPVGDAKFGETSLTEKSQEILAFLLFIGFLVIGWKVVKIRHFSFVVSLFFLMSFIREFNDILDDWFYFVVPLLAISLYIIVRYFKRLIDGFYTFLKIPSSAFLFVGILVTYVFSRLFGREKFWELLMEDGYMRNVKATVEEGVELLGYSLVFIALIELLVGIPKLLKQEEKN